MSTCWVAQTRNKARSRAQASVSICLSGAQSSTQGMGRFWQRFSRAATLSAARYSGAVQATPPALPIGARTLFTASATSLGIENHCGAERPNNCA